MEGADDLIRNINRCFLVKLARNYDEAESHTEIDNRNNNLTVNIKAVLDGLEKIDLKKSLVDDTAETVKGCRIAIISTLLNLYRELLCDCSWNTPNSKECAKKLNRSFNHNCEIQIGDVLKGNDVCDSQTVFDKVLDQLCLKLTAAEFKKFPGQVEVYCYLVQNCLNFDVTVQALKILPFTLVLIDDYIVDNKIKGLRCCQALLQTLTSEDFSTGNYYDVIYISVKNALNQKDIKVTELSQACLLALCDIIPATVKDEKLDELYSDALEQINTESNLHRKAAFFRFAKKILQTLQIKCVGKSLFKTIICENIENCLTTGVADILLVPCLETSEDFSTGNYYDVIYISVKNALNQKDIKVTELSQACLLALCDIIPATVKDEKLDELYSDALEQINTESNLHRKAAFFRFAKKILQTLQIKCVGKSLFKTIICENIENCLTTGVADILLVPCLECLEEWLKYCWPVWKLPIDFRILCALLKYFSKTDTEESLLAQKIIVTLIALCSPEEQKQFVAKLTSKDIKSTKIGELLMKDIGI